MSFDGKSIKSSDTVELLGITLDKNISFKRHIQNICHKANNKTKALFRIRKFLNLEQAQVLAEAYISSNFRYSPLIWMFCGKMSDNLIVRTHYRTLRAIYDTQTRSYEELLHLSGKKKLHTQNLQILMVEVYKCLNNLSPLFTWDYFEQKNNPYYLRNAQLLELSKCRTKTYGLNTTLFKGALLWNKLPIILRKQSPLYISKIKFGNGQGGHVLLHLLLRCLLLKNVHMRKKNFKICCNIFIFLAIFINISIIIYFFLIYLFKPVIITFIC